MFPLTLAVLLYALVLLMGQTQTKAVLATPVADTVKRMQSGAALVASTVEREGLWLAQTPQMFRLGQLLDALERQEKVTDEASAIELNGGEVKLVEGDRDNFKVTSQDDLEMMRRLLGGA